MLGNIKDKALEAQKMTTDAAGSAWEKTVESKDQAGTKVSETSTVVVDKSSQIAQSTQETAVAGKDVVVDKASQIAQSTQETAVAGKDKTGGVLQNTGQTIMNAAQSTGQTVMNAAQGATETVKNTLGMGGGTTDTTKIAQSTQETAVAGKDKTGGVLQSTGETVVNAAQGATETVKNSLGMGDGGNVTVTPINNDNSTPTITPIKKT